MNTGTTPKDFFLHLGATIALYASAIALINLAFGSINRALPDALSNYFNANSIVWPISMLIVLIPVLYVIEWLIGRDISKTIEKKDIWIRKWRIYLTLFLTGATIAGDFITLISTYLNGEISSRFIFKVLIVLVVSAVIFAYYLLERMDGTLRGKKWKIILAWLGIILVSVGIISGFIIVGSPATQRAQKFDDQRINDLTNIQWQIINYWQNTGKLPQTLDILNDPVGNYLLPKDPDTRVSYEYSMKGTNSFELCANFSLVAQNLQGSNIELTSYPVKPISVGINNVNNVNNANWSHSSGRVCFNRTIDPELYPVIQKRVIK